jgi:PIN domain nuclease of toxin-antitoxin system
LRLLLDTHYCLWLTIQRERLRTAELAVIVEPENDIAYSSVAIWELRIKWEKRYVAGARKRDASPIDVLDSLRAAELPAIDLTPALAAAQLREPIAHRDPFDELLLTVAQETDQKLFTRNNDLRGHPLAHFAD